LIQLLKRRWFAIALLLVLMSVLAACSGAPAVTSWPGMVVRDNTAYIASSDQVYALDVTTNVDAKRQVWVLKPIQSTSIGYHSQPAISADGKTLYLGADAVTGNSGLVIAVNTENVTVTWTYPLTKTDIDPGSIYGGIILANEKLFFAGGHGQLFALDAATGRPAWNQPFDPNTNTRVWSTPAVNDKLVFIASQDHHVYAVNQSDGSQAWVFPAPGDQSLTVGTFAGSPAVYGDTIYVGSFDSNLYALDLNGKLKWKFTANGRLWDPPAESDGTLYFGDLSGNMYALDAATGHSKWPQSVTVIGGVRATPLIANSKIFVGTDQFKMYALDAATGRSVWQNPFSGKDGEMFVVTPAIYSTTLVALPNLAGGTPTRLYGLNADTGAQLFAFPAPAP
jgi:eukaryotic-like serine/threonine-protein kinase